MLYILMALFAGAIVAADQLSKLWVVNHIGSYICADSAACAAHLQSLEKVYHISAGQMQSLPRFAEGIDGLFGFLHIHNTGAAFSSFEGAQWLFVLVFVVFTGLVVYEFATNKTGFSVFERWCVVAIYGGAVGNMIDRVRLGFVVDMIHLEFMDFPVFNVADCFITCGCLALIVSILFIHKDFWKEEKKSA